MSEKQYVGVMDKDGNLWTEEPKLHKTIPSGVPAAVVVSAIMLCGAGLIVYEVVKLVWRLP